MSVNMFFCCDSCGNLDSLRTTEQQGGGMRCFRCIHGQWHDAFPEQSYDPHLHLVINRPANPDLADGAAEPSFG